MSTEELDALAAKFNAVVDESRPVVWCRKIHKTGEYEKSSSGHIAVWTSDSAKAFLINRSIPMSIMELGKFEKYTGEQK